MAPTLKGDMRTQQLKYLKELRRHSIRHNYWYSLPHFLDEKTKAQSSEITCPKSHSNKAEIQDPQPANSATESALSCDCCVSADTRDEAWELQGQTTDNGIEPLGPVGCGDTSQGPSRPWEILSAVGRDTGPRSPRGGHHAPPYHSSLGGSPVTEEVSRIWQMQISQP